MDTKHDTISTGLERLNALMTWWGVPRGLGSENVKAQAERLQVLATDLSRAFNDASSCQLRVLLATNERLGRALEGLARGAEPQRLMAVQSEVMASLLESLAAQTTAWVQLTQKVRDCCATAVEETPEVTHEKAKHAARALGRAATEFQPKKPENIHG
jgi:hypothetical protein